MRIKDIRLLECNFILNKECEKVGEHKIDTNIQFRSDYEDDTRVATCFIRASVEDSADSPYSLSLEIGGKFLLEEEEIEFLERICTINIPAILFPYLREHVADITRRAGHPPMHLASVNFVEAARLKKEKEAEIED